MISPAPKRGFSLLELMVVVAITLVVSAVALPNVMSAISAYRLQTNASSLAGMFQKARMRAVTDDQWNVVAQATDSGRTYIFADLHINGVPNGVLDPEENQLVVHLPRGIVIDNTGAPDRTSMNLDFTPRRDLPAFNARGLPCRISGDVCQPRTAVATGVEGSGYVCYLRQDRSLGSVSWAAVTVSPAGRVRVWTWNGTAWK